VIPKGGGLEEIQSPFRAFVILRCAARIHSAEFLAVYGRRRVGKTFLIRQVYQKQIAFQMTGIATTFPIGNTTMILAEFEIKNTYTTMIYKNPSKTRKPVNH
jgi:hypothetical protein